MGTNYIAKVCKRGKSNFLVRIPSEVVKVEKLNIGDLVTVTLTKAN